MLIFEPATAGSEATDDLVLVLFLNAGFALLFAGSGVLFRQAHAGDPPAVSGRPTLTH